MTYQDTLSQGGQTGSFSAALSGVANFFRTVGNAMVKGSPGQARLNRAEALEAKSDAELARMGIKREDIVRHVFRDLYYI